MPLCASAGVVTRVWIWGDIFWWLNTLKTSIKLDFYDTIKGWKLTSVWGISVEFTAFLFIIQTGSSLGDASNGHVGRQRDRARLRKNCARKPPARQQERERERERDWERVCTLSGEKKRRAERANLRLFISSLGAGRYRGMAALQGQYFTLACAL